MNNTTKIVLGVGGGVVALAAIAGAVLMSSPSPSSVSASLPSYTGDSSYYQGGRRKRTRRRKHRK